MSKYINQTYAINGRRRAPAKPAASRIVAGIAAIAQRVLETLVAWQERANGRRELLSLDNRTLNDIGISRADAEREADKPFWRR